MSTAGWRQLVDQRVEYECVRAHQPAFPRAGYWRLLTGTPVMEMLDARRCPLCPSVDLHHPAHDDGPAYDEDTLLCACCGSSWTTTAEDELLWRCGAAAVATDDPWSTLGGRRILAPLSMTYSTRRGDCAVLAVDRGEILGHPGSPEADEPMAPALSAPGSR